MADAVSGRPHAREGESYQECGGPPLEAHVSRLHGHDPFLPPSETRSCVAHTRQGSDPPHHARGTGTKHPYGDRRGESVHPRMGWLLSPGHSDRPVRHTGSMDSPAPPQNPVGAMEETADSVSQNGRATRGSAARSPTSATTSPGTPSSGSCTTTGSTLLPSGTRARRGRRSCRRTGKAWRPPIYSRSRCSHWPVCGGISSSS